MIQIIQLKGKESRLYRLVAPLVMDPEVIRANNNYPFKTGDKYVWFVAMKNKRVVGFMPVERKTADRAVINNYYVETEDEGQRIETLSLLLTAAIEAFGRDKWMLQSVTLIQDKETFEKFDFVPMDPKWTRYVKMYR